MISIACCSAMCGDKKGLLCNMKGIYGREREKLRDLLIDRLENTEKKGIYVNRKLVALNFSMLERNALPGTSPDTNET